MTAQDILDYADEHDHICPNGSVISGRERVVERLIEYQRNLFEQYDKDELIEVLMDWCTNGVKAYEVYDDDDYLTDLNILIESYDAFTIEGFFGSEPF